jgi:hypothetical protein
VEIKVGNRVKFKEEKQSYLVRACNEQYLVCTKPFNARKTYLYCIVDLVEGMRGPDNSLLGPIFDVDTKEGAEEMLKAFVNEKGRFPDRLELSPRRSCKLNIERILEDSLRSLRA